MAVTRSAPTAGVRPVCGNRRLARDHFWLNWTGALILPLHLLASHPDLSRPAQAVLVGEAVSTFLWRLPAVFHTQRSRRGPSLAAPPVWGTSEKGTRRNAVRRTLPI